MTTSDPFGTAASRDSVLRAWRDSPTRFTEDANAEEDLRLGGYADRLFVELAQNAADAATVAGVPGAIRVTVTNDELRVANTGAPLDTQGVAALASLRASAKRGGVTVGRFGVGFAAVLAVSTEPRIVSRTGGVAFSATRTRKVVGELTEVTAQLDQRAGTVPVLRLVWPVSDDEPPVPAGFDTDVRLPLAPEVDADALLAEVAAEVDDLLLTLPVLERIEVGTEVWTRTTCGDTDVRITGPDGLDRRWRLHSVSGEFTAADAATLGIEAAQHPRWTALWALPINDDGAPLPLAEDVLHAPTPTDERLSLPARLIATAPIEPSRKRVLGGPAVATVLRAAADAYPELARRVAPEHRLALVPAAGFPRSEVDAQIRELITEQLRAVPWLPAAVGGEVAGGAARVLEADSADLVSVLADVVPDLVAAPLAGPRGARVLVGIGATPVSIAEAVDQLAAVDRGRDWWRAVYDALLPLLDARAVAADALAGLPVPLLDGRTLPGARGVLLPGLADDLLDAVAEAGILGLRVAHPEVAHPLLTRLGATPVGSAELLDAPEVRAAVERSVDEAPLESAQSCLAELVLQLVSDIGGSGPDRRWLGALALPDADGEVRRADELVLPGAPLLEVLDPDEIGPDGALAVIGGELAERWGADVLTAVGVLDTFAVVADPDPIAPDHDLADEQQWWDSLPAAPAEVLAVADLDLVADDRWPAAIRLLAERRRTWQAVTVPGGYTSWWLAQFAAIGGEPPRHWRLPASIELDGLYPVVPDTGLSADVLRTVGVRHDLTLADVDDAADLLDRLADPAGAPGPGVVLRAHAALAALTDETDALDPPARVRALDGSVIDAGKASVLDAPWLLEVAGESEVVAGSSESGQAQALADVLDLPLTSESLGGVVGTQGEFAAWTDLAAIRAIAELLGVGVPDGGVWLHDGLALRVDGTEHRARWWVDAEGRVHADDVEEGLARAFAHAVGRWDDRHLLAALLTDPTAGTLLG